MLVRAACLLAGLESPTHALRADADPSAQSASATYITLAQEHPYDRHIEILLHLSEPHRPLVILEKGRLSFTQYEQQICSRRDFIRCTRKDSEAERKYVRRRHHKDILCSPVLMLNFCPDLLSEPLELHKATRELLFLIDRSGSMSAMVVALKSLPSGTMLNIVGFGTTIKPLFSSSRLCTDVSDPKLFLQTQEVLGTNLLGALSWLYQQPMQRSYPRQVFIITDGSISSVARVLELVRRNTCAGRCFGLGLGPRACRRLLLGITKLTGGIAEFLDDEERLQPKLIKSLKKAFEPVLTDVRIDWYLPENMEALLSPNEIPPLYPGDCLIGYCTLYDMSYFKAKTSELEWSSDIRKRIQEKSYIQEQYVLTHCSLSSERSLPMQSQAHIHSSHSDSAGGGFLYDSHSSGPVLETGSLPQGLERMPQPEPSSLSRWADSTWQQTLSAETSENGLLFPASPLDWDSFTDPEYFFTAVLPEDPPPGQCRSHIHGLLSGRPVSWEVTVDLGHLWTSEGQATTEADTFGVEGEDAGHPWEEIIHQLTARSVIRDFEKLAEKEGDPGHGDDLIYAFSLNSSKGSSDSTDIRNTGGQTNSNLLVRLQLASGAFLLTEIYSDCVQIPLDRLKRASPYSLHRRSLSPAFRCISPSAPSLSTSTKPPGGPVSHHVTFSPSSCSLTKPSLSISQSLGQADSGRGSETDVCDGSSAEPAGLQGSSQLAQEDLEGSTWATAVALAWLEHRCAGYFMEWELVAAKADFWLRCQKLPEGVDLGGLRGAARQLFLLLRHWDENIKLNMLCYNPNNM
uniref:von Willebrand factor A domain containing 5B2 n=1 Tax=Nothobranchius furzeri TaxID=105023 RepID=A0A8C6PS88_NOTFU